MRRQLDLQRPAPPSQAWGIPPDECGARQLCKRRSHHPEQKKKVVLALRKKVITGLKIYVCACVYVCVVASVVYLNHVKVILIGENSIHLTVQLLEGALDGVTLHNVTALIFTDEMMACKINQRFIFLGLHNLKLILIIPT